MQEQSRHCARAQPDLMHLKKELMSLLAKQTAQDVSRLHAFLNVSKLEHGNVGVFSGDDRDVTARWLVYLSKELRFHPETCCTAINLLDRFLSLVKAHRKYLRCIGVTCLYLAAKTLEEDEVIPDTLTLIRKSQCGNSVAEVYRMEKEILAKVQWSVVTVTSLDILHNLYAQLILSHPNYLSDLYVPVSASEQLSVLTDKLHDCLCYHGLLQYSPATVAVAVISLELEQCSHQWFPLTTFLQSKIQIAVMELIHCREQISSYLSFCKQARIQYRLKPREYLPIKATKRKIEQCDSSSNGSSDEEREEKEREQALEGEEDDVYYAIKCLYSSDAEQSTMSSPDAPAVGATVVKYRNTPNNTTHNPAAATANNTASTTCSMQACQDSASGALALQSVAN